jgi:hypothetical protein
VDKEKKTVTMECRIARRGSCRTLARSIRSK